MRSVIDCLAKTLGNGRIFTVFCSVLLLVLGINLWPSPPQISDTEYHVKESHLVEHSTLIIPPIPDVSELDQAKVKLGNQLFFDTRLSADNSIACAHCHNLAKGGADGLPLSIGIGGKKGIRNAPTVFNATLNYRQFWDGRARTLEEQAEMPVTNLHEMGSNWPQVVNKLSSDDNYQDAFTTVYQDGITAINIMDAISTFESTLLTPNAPFDRFLKGDQNALTAEAKQGYQLFTDLGCIACHQGVNLGGNMFEKLGVIEDYFDESPEVLESADLGRFHLTGIEEHQYEFRVPGLRNVAMTEPYLHDGSVETLEKAVKLMARHQLGIKLSTIDTKKIVAFFESLTGEFNDQLLR